MIVTGTCSDHILRLVTHVLGYFLMKLCGLNKIPLEEVYKLSSSLTFLRSSMFVKWGATYSSIQLSSLVYQSRDVIDCRRKKRAHPGWIARKRTFKDLPS